LEVAFSSRGKTLLIPSYESSSNWGAFLCETRKNGVTGLGGRESCCNVNSAVGKVYLFFCVERGVITRIDKNVQQAQQKKKKKEARAQPPIVSRSKDRRRNNGTSQKGKPLWLWFQKSQHKRVLVVLHLADRVRDGRSFCPDG
jgi:hypothetical protein